MTDGTGMTPDGQLKKFTSDFGYTTPLGYVIISYYEIKL
jgi:hypothetical protein